jgi:hypothetical protein
MMHGAKALLAGAAMKMLDFVTSPWHQIHRF